jgi:hypothetical protein
MYLLKLVTNVCDSVGTAEAGFLWLDALPGANQIINILIIVINHVVIIASQLPNVDFTTEISIRSILGVDLLTD